MDSLRAHLELDPDHHTYGARGLVVGPQAVHLETPVRFRSRTPNTEAFTEPGRVDFRGVGHEVSFASVAQMVERSPEEGSGDGSIPSRGTGLKRKR